MVRKIFPVSLWYLVVGQALQSLALSALSLALVFVGVEESNPTGIGFILAARTLPTIGLALVGGIAADKCNRVRLASSTLILSGGVHIVLALCLFRYGLGWQVYAVSFTTGLIGAFGSPSLYSLLPSIIPAAQNVSANALVRGARNFMAVIGPALAGILIPICGYNIIFIAIAVLTILAGVAVACIRYEPHEESHVADTNVDDRSIGARYLSEKYPWFLFSILMWAALLSVESGASSVTLPFVFLEAGSQSQWSFVISATSLGYIIVQQFWCRCRYVGI
ncbi:MAG: MFS transporter [Corynebacterium sp.]|nr:MFS transporter [Corynebacterium sp.]